MWKETTAMHFSLSISKIDSALNKFEEVLTITDENKYKMTCHLKDESGNPIDVSGIKYQFYVKNNFFINEHETKEVIGNEDGTFTFDEQWNFVFCYGKEVDNFHTLDKQKLYTLNFRATQDLDRRQKNIRLQLHEAEEKISILESQQSDLLSRLEAIEKRLENANI